MNPPTDSEIAADQTDDSETVQTRLSDFVEESEVCTDGGIPIDSTDDDTEDTDETPSADDDSESANSTPEAATETNSSTTVESQTDKPSPPATLTPSVEDFIHLDRKNRCELCDADGENPDVSLNIHHRHKQADGGTNHPDNILLLCERCHNRHHGTTPAPRPPAEGTTQDESPDQSAEEDKRRMPDEPLPPQSSPSRNGTDSEVLSVIEKQGPVRTSDIAAQVDSTKQTVRRICWKLSGEQLVARTTGREWALREHVEPDDLVIGLPDDPKQAQRAGRDEVIRQMSAHNIPHTEIAEITGLSRQTVSVAVDRARALRIDDTDPTDVGYATIAQRLTALVDLLDHAHDQTTTD
jgi:5-methylcytosine-specific restriction endonuclease McrA/predicted ArsR family transcriptional regulator